MDGEAQQGHEESPMEVTGGIRHGFRAHRVGRQVSNIHLINFLSSTTAFRTPFCLVDEEGRVACPLPGCPDDDDWGKVIADAERVINEVREEGLGRNHFQAKDLHSRRGDFVVLATGVSFGGGQQRPGNLVHSAPRRRLLEKLLSNKSIQRIAGFQSSEFFCSDSVRRRRYHLRCFCQLCSQDLRALRVYLQILVQSSPWLAA